MPEKPTPPLIIFADGASSGNPGPGGWGAVIVTPVGNVLELGGRVNPTTNNRMELTAVISALARIDRSLAPIEIYTDSSYVIRGATQWIWGWRKRGWISSEGKEVANQDLWKELSSLTYQAKIEWKYVRGHSGVPGNERVDEIAVEYSKGIRPHLYEGPLLKYDIAIYDIPENTELPEQKPKDSGVKAKAFSYLSCVDHKVEKHSTWAECEKRVRGRSGAKFKKAMSAEDEAKILRSWGF